MYVCMYVYAIYAIYVYTNYFCKAHHFRCVLDFYKNNKFNTSVSMLEFLDKNFVD